MGITLLFSDMIASHDSKLIKEACDSIINQKLDFKDLKAILDNEKIKEALNESKMETLKDSLSEVLRDTDDDFILTQNDADFKLKCFILKYGEIPKDICLKLNLNTIYIDIYEIIENKLYILANMPNIDNKKIDVFVNQQKITTKEINFPQRDKYCLDYKFATDYSLEFSIPLNQNDKFEIEFKCGNEIMEIDFSRPCNFSKIVGYAKTKHYLSILKENKITIEKKTTSKWIKQELKSLVNMLKKREPGLKVGVPFRIAYMLGYPFLKNKRIWFFMDRPDASDDNGMHLFRYAVDKDPDIKKYFIIDKNTPDYGEMKKIGNVLGFKSLKHRYLGLFAENIITTHPDNQIIYPFWGTYPYFAGLLKSSTMFLQHGIIKEDISSWLTKFDMNLSFFLTSSRLEYESIFKYPYHYDKSVVQKLGLPRYDALENARNKKQIIIMPSWRRDLTGKSKEYVKQSEYFKRFNSLINNERLIENARKNGYEIIFRPHPNVYYYIELFDENEYVQIDYDKTKYQTLFNNGSLLLTDYSSVAFDFAYLYKPVLYYHYGTDYHFDAENSFFDYEEMGFGEICKSEEELVDSIIEYMENDCEIKDKYSKRISAFYEFRDKNNCKRVYDKIKSIKPKD